MEQKWRILVVDDDEFVVRVLDDTLSEHFEVQLAGSGEEALEHLGRTEFAVLLADQRMPGLSGIELAERARQIQPHLVSVLVSAFMDPDAIIAAINEAQVFRFLQKPWSASELVHTLQQAAERYRLGRDNEALISELERRLRALEILQDVLGAVTPTANRHAADVLLDRLGDVIVYDLAAVLLTPAADVAELKLKTRGRVSAANVAELRDRMLELFAYSGGTPPEEGAIRLSAAVDAQPDAELAAVESQVQVPLTLDGRVVGVLAVQAFRPDAFPPDTARLLDLLANGAAGAVERMRLAAGRQWHLLERTLAALPDGVVAADADGRVLVANAAARRLLGSACDVDVELWRQLDLDPAELGRGAFEPVERRLELNGRSIRAMVTVIEGEPSAELEILVVLCDATELVGESLLHREFISTLSHEIRTPLTSIIATLELLRAETVGPLNEKQAAYLRIAANAGDTIQQMINGILDIEKFSRGHVDLNLRPLPIAGLMRELVARYGAAATERGLTLVFEPGASPITAEVDAYRFEQIVGNLLSNAVKFAPRESAIRVTLASSANPAGWTVLGIHNGGDPVPPEDLALMFERFRQAGGSRPDSHQAGTGLGLAICRSLVEAHGGGIFAESGRGGTSLWVAVPERQSEPPLLVAPVFGPVWLDCRGPDADRIAAAATLARCGLTVHLLPSDAKSAAAARQAVGAGLVVSVGNAASAAPGASLSISLHGGPDLAAVGRAIARLATGDKTGVSVTPPPGPAILAMLQTLGLSVGESSGAGDAVMLSERDAAAPALLEIAAQLSPEARRVAPIRALLRRVRGRHDWDRLAVIAVEHLAAFRAAYGARRAGQLRQALVDLTAAVVGADGRASVQEYANGVVLAGPAKLVEDVTCEVGERFRALARLHYRKQDREQGFVRFGGEDVPLADAEVRFVMASAPEQELLGLLADR